MSQVTASPPGTGGGDFAFETRSANGYSWPAQIPEYQFQTLRSRDF